MDIKRLFEKISSFDQNSKWNCNKTNVRGYAYLGRSSKSIFFNFIFIMYIILRIFSENYIRSGAHFHKW